MNAFEIGTLRLLSDVGKQRFTCAIFSEVGSIFILNLDSYLIGVPKLLIYDALRGHCKHLEQMPPAGRSTTGL